MNGFGLALALAAGITLSLFYFGGLWWTVNRLTEYRRPAVFYLVSYVARMAVLILCLSVVMQVGTVHLVCAIIGFFAGRFLLVNRTMSQCLRSTETKGAN